MAQNDPEDGKIPADSRPTSSNVAKGLDEDWVHVVPSEPVCRDLSASSCYVALPGANVDGGDGSVAPGEEVDHSAEIKAKGVSPKKSNASRMANVDDRENAVCNGEEAEHSVEGDFEKVSPKKSDAIHTVDIDDVDDAGCSGAEAEQPVEVDKINGASKATDHVIPPTRFNLILMQSKSPILHLLSARLVDRVEGQKPPDDHDSDVD